MYKCKLCKKSFTELQGLYNHIEKKHKDHIPKDMTVEQYYYYMKTGKVNGNCVMCKQSTTWNKNTCKYNRFCDNPRCKDEYRRIFKERMIGKYGKVHLLNDPNKQREMLANRSISGRYKWDDGTETVYTGSYEHDFLKMMDGFFDWDPADIMMPSPHTYTYEYEGEKRYYIPDVFIPSLNLEIEIKDGGDNPNMHHKIQDVDKVKEKNKDEVMISQKTFHYIKITNKNYSNFFDFLKEVKSGFEKYGDENKIPRIFKIEDIKTKKTKTIVTEGVVADSINNKLREINSMRVRDMGKITQHYIKCADSSEGFKAMMNHSIALMKSCKSKDDVIYVESIINTVHHKLIDEYQKNKITKDDVMEFDKWMNKDFKKELNKKKDKYMKESLILEENLLMSKDNIEMNIDKFGKTNNILYITGLGGSGKSTIISEYSKKYNAEALEFDAVTSALIRGLENLNRNKIHPIILEYLETQNPNKLNGFDDNNFNIESIKFLDWFENKVNNDGKLYIIEGMQIFMCFEPERFKNKPMVIMGTSVVKSMYRSNIRFYKRSGDILKTFKFFLKTLKRTGLFIKNDRQLDELINTVNESMILEEDTKILDDDLLYESSISYSKLNDVLQADTDLKLKQYLKTYDEYYHRMLKERPESVKHINDDVNKAVKYIEDLKHSGKVNPKLADQAIREFQHKGIAKKYICESTDGVNNVDLYLVFDPSKKRQVFSLSDNETKLFIGESLYINRKNVNCVTHPDSLENNINGKRVVHLQAVLNEVVSYNLITTSVVKQDVKVNNLYKLDGDNTLFFKEICDLLGIQASVNIVSDKVYDGRGCVIDGK